MKVCFFGSYDPLYTRNKILIDGLIKLSSQVYHCRSEEKWFLPRYAELIKKFLPLRSKADILFVVFVGQLNMPLAWLLGKLTRKKVIFDMFYSMYDTYVFDRRSVPPDSFRALTYYWIDKIAAILAETVIADTHTHAQYLSELLKIPLKKFQSVYVGGDETVFKARHKKLLPKVVVEFHGMFTRLSGAEVFIKAAKRLEDDKRIEFWLIGESFVYQEPLRLLKQLKPKNLKYFPEVTLTELAKKVTHADITIGHLGTTDKAQHVISHKTYQGLASANALIVIDSPANRELLTDKSTALFVKAGSVDSLTDAILHLVNYPKIRLQLAQNGHRLFKEKLTNVHIAQTALKIFNPLLS